jgi:DNA polymerase-3 subunit gamma/tau
MGSSTTAYSTSAVSQSNGAGQTLALATDAENALARFPTFEHVIELIRANRDVKLLVEVETCIRLAAYRPGRIEFTATPEAPHDLAQRLGSRLQGWTGSRWAVTLVNGATAATIAEIKDAASERLRQDAIAHPLVQAVLAAFPKARITDVRSNAEKAAEAEAQALPVVEDEWDPFEED